MERQTWNLERITTELKFVLLQVAGILYGSFARHFSPFMSLICLMALLSMHAFSNEGLIRWSEIREARGWALFDLLLTKLGEIILLSWAVSWQVRFTIDVMCLLLGKCFIHWFGYSDRVAFSFINSYCTMSPLKQFEYFCHIFCLYYLVIVLNIMNNIPLE